MPDDKPKEGEAKSQEGAPKIGDQSGQVAELLAGFEAPAPKKEPEKEPVKEGEKPPEKEGEKPPEKPPEKKAEEPPKGDEKDELIKQLQTQVKELSTRLMGKPEPKKEPEKLPEKPPEKKEPEREPEKPGLGFFKDAAEYDKAFEDPKVMNDVLSRVHSRAEENILRRIPQVLDTVVRTQLDMYMRTYKFYDENPEMKEHKEFVGFVANDVSGKNPDWTLDKLFEELPGEVRKRIGLKKEAEGKSKSSDKPGFAPGKTGSRKPSEKKDELTPLEQQISDLMV